MFAATSRDIDPVWRMSRAIDMRCRFRSAMVLRLAIAGGLLCLPSCRPAFPRELFVVSGQGADYPIMLSQTPPTSAGRKIAAASGTAEHHYQQRNYGF